MKLKTLPTLWVAILGISVLMLLAVNRQVTTQNTIISQKSSPFIGGRLVWGTINAPTIINPVLTSHSVSASLMELIYDPLVHLSPQGEIIPGLAQEWDISQDGLKYTFHLIPHVFFHDGHECTAEDVKYTYDLIKDPASQSPWRSGVEVIKECKVLDRYTIEMTMDHPAANGFQPFLREILPKHLYQGRDLLSNPRNTSPIGSGPYVFEQWDKATGSITLKANARYFAGRPNIETIFIRVFPNNKTLISALMREEVDFVKFINQEDYQLLRFDPRFRAYQVNSGINYAIVFDTSRDVLKDRSIRQAINYAIDRDQLMGFCHITGEPSNGPFSSNSMGYNTKVEVPTYDPARAQKLLNHSGWHLNHKENLFYKNYRPLCLTMLVDRNRWYMTQIAMVLRQQLSEAGIRLKVVYYDREAELTGPFLDNVQPHLWLRSFINSPEEESSDAARSWYSQSSEFGRIWAYHNSQVDKLFKQSQITSDLKERAAIYQQIHALIYQDQPACFLFFSVSYHAVSSRVNNTDRFFTPFMGDYLIKEWHISTRKEGQDHGNYQGWNR